MVKEILNASQAATVIGCSKQRVRERIKRGIWDIGEVVKGKQQNCYEINIYKLADFLHISVEEIERRLGRHD